MDIHLAFDPELSMKTDKNPPLLKNSLSKYPNGYFFATLASKSVKCQIKQVIKDYIVAIVLSLTLFCYIWLKIRAYF